MSFDITGETLQLKGSEIHAFRTNEHYFKIPYSSKGETTASVREVCIDGRYTFTGLCVEDLTQTVGCVLDLSNGIVFELVSF